MQELICDEKNRCLLWKTGMEMSKESVFSWKMMENNRIEGLLPFEHYYIDNQNCFRYAFGTMQTVAEIMQGGESDYETFYFLCFRLLTALKSGEEYLLQDTGYLLEPDKIFWEKEKKEIALCYLPGQESVFSDSFLKLLEYLLRHVGHSDKRTVEFIYGLYDLAVSGGISIENLSGYAERFWQSPAGRDDNRNSAIKPDQKPVEEFQDGGCENCRFCLRFVENGRNDKTGIALYGKNAYELQGQEMAVGREQDSDLHLPYDTVSRRHAVLFQEDGEIFLMDMASRNGTFVNGDKISAFAKTKCRENDVIRFADISFRLIAAG